MEIISDKESRCIVVAAGPGSVKTRVLVHKVSTIHKAKGKEFDNVYMIVTDRHHYPDAYMRRLYVGITRAKKQLFIHTDSTVFQNFSTPSHLRDTAELHYNNLTFYNPATGNPVARLSRKMAGTLSGWETKGYRVCSASVRFIVAWRPKDTLKTAPETAVTLIDLNLSKTARQKATIS